MSDRTPDPKSENAVPLRENDAAPSGEKLSDGSRGTSDRAERQARKEAKRAKRAERGERAERGDGDIVDPNAEVAGDVSLPPLVGAPTEVAAVAGQSPEVDRAAKREARRARKAAAGEAPSVAMPLPPRANEPELAREQDGTARVAPGANGPAPNGVEAVVPATDRQPRLRARRAGRAANAVVRAAAEPGTDQTSTVSEPPASQTAGREPTRDEGRKTAEEVATGNDLLAVEEAQDDSLAEPSARVLKGPLSTSVRSGNTEETELLLRQLRDVFASDGIDIVPAADAADLVIDLGGGRDSSPAGRVATFWVDRQGRQTGAQVSDHDAMREGAFVIPFDRLAWRYAESASNGEPLSASGAVLLTAAIRDLLFFSHASSLRPASGASIGVPADLAEAVELSRKPSELLKTLSWSDELPPRSLRVIPNPENVAHFLDGQVCLRERGGVQAVEYYFPFDWHVLRPGRSAEHMLYGLDFVSEVLAYWNLKAIGQPAPKFGAVEAGLKQRGITAASLLGATGAVILDCARAQSSLPDEAWQVAALQRRARACESFLLCCRIASARRIAFEESMCAEVFRVLLATLERLRITALAFPGTSAGVAHTALLIALAIPLRRTTYGKLLIEEARDALLSIHLESGLSEDGVWREGFAQHASVFDLLSTLSIDLRPVEGRKPSLSEALAKLSRFIDAYLAQDGTSPALSETAPAPYGKILRAARASMKPSLKPPSAAGKPEQAPLLFPRGGYFIGRSEKPDDPRASHLVLQARSAAQGGPTLSFRVGPDDLLVGGGTLDRRAPAPARAFAKKSPAAHNFIRVNGLDYPDASSPDGGAVIEQAWREQHWSAARLTMQAFPQAVITRTVIHLEPVQALLVVDELLARMGSAQFEQFWHVSPRLWAQDVTSSGAHFTCPGGGVLTAQFDSQVPLQMQDATKDGLSWVAMSKREVLPNPYLVRTLKAERAVLGSFFRWASGAVAAGIDLASEGPDGWRVMLRSGDSQISFASRNGQLALQK